MFDIEFSDAEWEQDWDEKMNNENINTLPNDIMDYICKSSAWLNNMIDNDDIKKVLIKMSDKLLDKYDFENKGK